MSNSHNMAPNQPQGAPTECTHRDIGRPAMKPAAHAARLLHGRKRAGPLIGLAADGVCASGSIRWMNLNARGNSRLPSLSRDLRADGLA